MIHCQDAEIDRATFEALRTEGHVSAAAWPLLRSAKSEDAGTARATSLAASTGCPAYVVHVSTRASLECLVEARRHGTKVHIEVRPIHLWFSAERYRDPDAWLTFSGYPPLRSREDVDRLWQAVIDGDVDVVGSDHAAWTRDQKRAGENDPTMLPVGMPGLETLRSAVFTAGVVTGRIPETRFVGLTATNAARLLGLGSRKGSIVVGQDADLVLWDPSLVRRVDVAEAHAGVDLEPFHGLLLQGHPSQVLSRGTSIYRGGTYIGTPGRGRLVKRYLH